ncbi:MAG: DUF6161 domain-containing protein [Bacteroidota bacterium]
METKEVRDFILRTPIKDWYENAEYSFPFRDSTGEIKKKGFLSIYEFVEKQIKDFLKIESIMPSALNSSKSYFSGLKNDLEQMLKRNYQHEHQLKSEWQNLNSKNRNRGIGILGPYSVETKFLIELNKVSTAMVQGAFLYFMGQEIPKDKFGFAGALKAYEFSMDGGAKISRPPAEKATLTKLSKEIESALDQSNQLLIDHLATSRAKSKEFSEQIEELKGEKNDLFSTWFKDSQKEFKDLSEKIDTRRQELEKTYNEIFFLKEPAKYWKDRAEELGVDGRRYLRYLYILIGVGAVSLFVLLWQIPDGILLNIFKGEASAIKWTIVYVTFISFLAFGIKTLSKLAYSTYHLKRDAEERHQLTYVYLSLVNDKKIDDKDRQLVLQSLFSRADTGLLKDDSSPTMPGLIGSVFSKPSSFN